MTTPKTGPKKTLLLMAFNIIFTLHVKSAWFGRQMAVCVNKQHKNGMNLIAKVKRLAVYCIRSCLFTKNYNVIEIGESFVESNIMHDFGTQI